MGPRASLIALAALAVVVAVAAASCGDDSTSYGGNDMAAGGGHDMGMGGCTIDVNAVDIDTGKVKTTAPARLVAQLHASGGVSPMWDVERGSTGEHFMVTKTTSQNGYNVYYDAMDADTWIFHVRFANGGCMPSQSFSLTADAARKVLYILRATPTESSMYTRSDTTLTLYGGSPKTDFGITLATGTPVAGTLRGPSGATRGEVRLFGELAPDADTVTDANGSFTLAVLGTAQYTPLLIPSSPSLAPHLGAKTSGVMLATMSSFDVGAGATVTGTIVDGSAAGVDGARVTMRAGLLPSGAGQADAAGAFTLHAEPATYTLSFGARDWPEGTLAGVAVPAGGASVAIAYTIPRVAVAATVVGSDGTTPVTGARVTITSRPLGNVADVVVGGGAAQQAQGRVARVEIADSNGKLPAMQLPAGTYDIIIEPPGPTMDGLTAVTKVLAGAATWTLQLEKPVMLHGTVRGPMGQAVAGAQVTAIETVGLGAAPTATTDGNGQYALAVGSGAPTQLVVEPTAAAKLAGTRLSLPPGTASRDVMLDAGLEVSGFVSSPTGAAVPLVRVDVLCVGCGSTTPITSAISDDKGHYKVYLPDPGLDIFDGGAGD